MIRLQYSVLLMMERRKNFGEIKSGNASAVIGVGAGGGGGHGTVYNFKSRFTLSTNKLDEKNKIIRDRKMLKVTHIEKEVKGQRLKSFFFTTAFKLQTNAAKVVLDLAVFFLQSYRTRHKRK